MSLIHDALRKAQQQAQEKAQASSASQDSKKQQSFASPEFVDASGIPKRTLVLASLCVIAVMFFAYTQFINVDKPAPVAKEVRKPLAVSSADQTAKEVRRLKQQALGAYRVADIESAWSRLSAASSIDKKDPDVWNNLGVVLRKRGDEKKARDAFKKALELRADCYECLNNLAVLDVRAGKYQSASKHIEQALQINANYPEALFHRALIADLDKNKKLAARHYKDFLKYSGKIPAHVLDQVRDHIINLDRQSSNL